MENITKTAFLIFKHFFIGSYSIIFFIHKKDQMAGVRHESSFLECVVQHPLDAGGEATSDLKGNILMLTNKHSKREKCVLYRGKTNSKTVDLTNKNTKSRLVIELLLERWEGHMQLIYCLLEN